MSAQRFDFAVIGAGIVGSAIARQLAGSQHSVVLIEAQNDVGDGTSKANTAVVHTGFDSTPGTLEARLVRRGHQLLVAYAERTGIPIETTGAILVAWTPEELAALPGLRDRAIANHYDGCELVDADGVYQRVPRLGPGALGGLTVPDEAITCTWTVGLALAIDAVNRGACLKLGHSVSEVLDTQDVTRLVTTGGDIEARWVINAAGLGADWIDAMFGYRRFKITPRRGELVVFDKLARGSVPCIILPVPTKSGKGVLVSPTIYGNVMVGPTAENIDDRTATGTTEAGLAFLAKKTAFLLPDLASEEITTTYAGLRAATGDADYWIDVDQGRRYALVGGIRSTGLTAGMAIAEYLQDLLQEAGCDFLVRPELPEPPRMPNLGESRLRPHQDEARIATDSDYGTIICFCERVTLGEIRDAFDSVIPPADSDGLRRRTRLMNGRCQGFYCGARARDLMESRAR